MRSFPGRFLEIEKLIYNYRLSRARRTIENTFGITAARWRILRRPIIATTETADSIVKAVVCLHNYLMITQRQRLGNNHYCSLNMADHDDGRGHIIDGEWRSIVAGDTGMQDIHRTNYNRNPEKAIEVREIFKRFFMSNEGQVPWQYHSVGRTNYFFLFLFMYVF
uniref:DDE Tnp4 domain-containing protein n=1 Tax=Strigamia maritima TaxID=126957 RepID=T1IUD8_STRMM